MAQIFEFVFEILGQDHLQRSQKFEASLRKFENLGENFNLNSD